MLRHKITCLGLVMLVAGAFSCVREEVAVEQPQPGRSGVVQISAEVVSPTAVDTRATTTTGGDAVKGEDLASYFTAGKSVLFITQAGSLSGEGVKDPNNSFLDGSGDRYAYVYNGLTEPDWQHNFNFDPLDTLGGQTLPKLDWEVARQWKYMANGYAFAAMYFPVDYKYRNAVERDQSVRDNFKKSDILAAWHRPATLDEERLRFKLYHIMSKVQVRLYLPKYYTTTEHSTKGGTGFTATEANQFMARALNMDSLFVAEWEGLSSEQAPSVRYKAPDTDSSDEGGETVAAAANERPGKYIEMYQTVKAYTDSTKVLTLGDYGILDDKGEKSNETEYCYWITFEMVVPQQEFQISNEDGSEPYLFRFARTYEVPHMVEAKNDDGSLKKDSNGQQVYEQGHLEDGSLWWDPAEDKFGFAPRMLAQQSGLTLRQGYVTRLELYVPRDMSEAIFLGSRILPWTASEQDFDLVQGSFERPKSNE